MNSQPTSSRPLVPEPYRETWGTLLRGLLVVLTASLGVQFVSGVSGLIRLAGYTDPRAVVLLQGGIWAIGLSSMLLSFEAVRRPAADPQDIYEQAIPVALLLGWLIVLGVDVTFVLLQFSGPRGAAIIDTLGRMLLGLQR
jgi:hypothetical protein